MRVDVHAHAFADKIAEHAIAALHSRMPANMRTRFDGKLSTLVAELDRHAIDAAVLCSIATKPSQFRPILDWSNTIRAGDFGEHVAEKIIPFPSVHPADPERAAHLHEIAKAGFKGIKVHPYYQELDIATPAAFEYFRNVAAEGLVATIHCGHDVAFPDTPPMANPERLLRLLEAVPNLKLLATHFGGWNAWDESARLLIGAPIDVEISLAGGEGPACGECSFEMFREMLLRHPAEKIYFGTDWPWSYYEESLARIARCDLPPERLEALMGGNAARLLSL